MVKDLERHVAAFSDLQSNDGGYASKADRAPLLSLLLFRLCSMWRKISLEQLRDLLRASVRLAQAYTDEDGGLHSCASSLSPPLIFPS